MYQSNIAKFQPLISFDTSTLSGTYQLAGVLAKPARLMIGVNGSTTAVTVSFDGTNDNAYFGASNATPQQFQFGSERSASSDSFELPQGTPIYVKGSSGTGIIAFSYVSAYLPPR